jgi:hypothetical protein
LPVVIALLLSGALTGRPYGLLALPAFVALIALGVLAGQLLWGRRLQDALRPFTVAAATAAATLALTFFAFYAIMISAGLCGYAGSSFEVLRWIILGGTYLAIGLWGFQRPQRLVWAWSLAVVAGFALLLGVTDALPSAHGYCEA